MPIDRRRFLIASPGLVLVPAALSHAAGDIEYTLETPVTDFYPAHSAELVSTIVGKAHVDIDTVRELVTDRPALAKAAWDWGFGDWESALGAASHMGRHDIAELLIAHGARPNLFTAAMMGHVDIVRAFCVTQPGVQRQLGPHGITLLQHARHGGDVAADVVDYLESLGDADTGQPNEPLSAEAAAAYIGTYRPAGQPNVAFHVAWHERRGGLTFQRDDRVLRFLNHLGDHSFAPGGGADVRLIFDVREGLARRLSLHDGSLIVAAARE